MKSTRRRVRPESSPRSNSYVLIWKAVEKIPRGKVSTYGAIAKLARREGQARLVGYALHNIPPSSSIPWQRVVNAGGRVSLPGDHGRKQLKLLWNEGVRHINGRINLKKHGWPDRH